MEVASAFVAWFYDILAFFGYTHPVHPIFVHITIGLVVAAMVFALIALVPQYNRYAITARDCVTFAFISAVPTMLVGLMDWVHYFGGHLSSLFKIKITLALILIPLLGLAVYLHSKLNIRSILLHIVYLAGFVNIVLLGYYGGELIHASATPHTETAADEDPDRDPDAVTYSQVSRIMQNQCVHCHSRHNDLGGLDLSSYDALMEGGDSGAVVEPGEPQESLLVLMLDGSEEPLMPLGGPELPQSDIDTISKWVEKGAER
ncbi:c-type cytochrome domain-containing protein [Halorhodospira halochloris]|uniref:c-type cytochrome domain-containing protein n=1 Tax=Halorhodospira halochloris TaxID=1052 RepID=UPI001EE954BA|nr:c-type cytochrome domain-containing protein [Halorhodospira halochloris]MCG5547698.1 hypothetical protein [Halorhodospira halochloris]